jgi:hypothetical protein
MGVGRANRARGAEKFKRAPPAQAPTIVHVNDRQQCTVYIDINHWSALGRADAGNPDTIGANAVRHTASGKDGGTFTARLLDLPGEYVLGMVEDSGSDWDGNLQDSARDASGLYLVLAISADCAGCTANGTNARSGSGSTTPLPAARLRLHKQMRRARCQRAPG